MKFKDFQAPVLFSSTSKALNLGVKNSITFKDVWEPCMSLTTVVDKEFKSNTHTHIGFYQVARK